MIQLPAVLCQKFQVGAGEAEGVIVGEVVLPVASGKSGGLREDVPAGETVVFVPSGDANEGEGIVVGVLTDLVAVGGATSDDVWA
jgi:hypothetical protein